MTPQSPSKYAPGTSHSSPNCHQQPRHTFLSLIDGLKSLPCQRWFQFGEKPEVTRCQIRAVGMLSHLGDLMSCQNCGNFVRPDTWLGMLLGWSCKSPVAPSSGLLNHPNSFCEGIFELNVRFDADLLLYSLSHFECHSCTVYMLPQRHLLPPLTSTVKSSLFTHAHSSPLSWAAKLHQCCANHSHYINNGCTFPDKKIFQNKVIPNTLLKFVLLFSMKKRNYKDRVSKHLKRERFFSQL